MEGTVPGIAGTLPDGFRENDYGLRFSDRLSPFSHISALGLS